VGTVGFCYLEGAGVDKDLSEARKWLKMASDNGISEASEALAGIPSDE